ncbi:hypothetical protein PFISCL1PPCAC_12485, partial [Pristionchus fissidentatus]
MPSLVLSGKPDKEVALLSPTIEVPKGTSSRCFSERETRRASQLAAAGLWFPLILILSLMLGAAALCPTTKSSPAAVLAAQEAALTVPSQMNEAEVNVTTSAKPSSVVAVPGAREGNRPVSLLSLLK